MAGIVGLSKGHGHAALSIHSVGKNHVRTGGRTPALTAIAIPTPTSGLFACLLILEMDIFSMALQMLLLGEPEIVWTKLESYLVNKKTSMHQHHQLRHGKALLSWKTILATSTTDFAFDKIFKNFHNISKDVTTECLKSKNCFTNKQTRTWHRKCHIWKVCRQCESLCVSPNAPSAWRPSRKVGTDTHACARFCACLERVSWGGLNYQELHRTHRKASSAFRQLVGQNSEIPKKVVVCFNQQRIEE